MNESRTAKLHFALLSSLGLRGEVQLRAPSRHGPRAPLTGSFPGAGGPRLTGFAHFDF